MTWRTLTPEDGIRRVEVVYGGWVAAWSGGCSLEYWRESQEEAVGIGKESPMVDGWTDGMGKGERSSHAVSRV